MRRRGLCRARLHLMGTVFLQRHFPQGRALSPVPGSGTQSWAGNSQVGCHRTVASHPGVVCSWPQSLPVQAVALLGPGEQDLGVRQGVGGTEGGRVWVGMKEAPWQRLLGLPCCFFPTPPVPPHLMELGQHRTSLLLFLILLHLGLQPPVVLQGLLPPFHCHVEAWEYAAEPVGHSVAGNRLLVWGCIHSLYLLKDTCGTPTMCQSHTPRLWGLCRRDDLSSRQSQGSSQTHMVGWD